MAYTGHFYHPQSGTHLAWFRGYDPRIGRWLKALLRDVALFVDNGIDQISLNINDSLNIIQNVTWNYDTLGRQYSTSTGLGTFSHQKDCKPFWYEANKKCDFWETYERSVEGQ